MTDEDRELKPGGVVQAGTEVSLTQRGKGDVHHIENNSANRLSKQQNISTCVYVKGSDVWWMTNFIL